MAQLLRTDGAGPVSLGVPPAIARLHQANPGERLLWTFFCCINTGNQPDTVILRKGLNGDVTDGAIDELAVPAGGVFRGFVHYVVQPLEWLSAEGTVNHAGLSITTVYGAFQHLTI